MKIRTPHFLVIIAFVMALALTASASTIKLSDYATPDDGQDDSAGFQAAVDALKLAGGGTIIVDSGTWDISRTVRLATYLNTISYHIKGDKGAIIRPHVGPWNVVFYPGNTNQFEMTDLIFLGDPNVDYDALYIAGGGYTSQMRITGCHFMGLHVRESIIHVDAATDAVLESNMFEGNAADVASVYAYNYRGLTVKNAYFFDYANFRDKYYSKTPGNIGNWIRAVSTVAETIPNANGQRAVRLEDIRLDEGAPVAIAVQNADFVFISGIIDNVSGVGDGAGILFDNVEFAEVKMSKFGYTGQVRPAIVALNDSKVIVTGISIGGGVYYGDQDTSSSVVFDNRLCVNCSARPIERPSGAAKQSPLPKL